jgi:hypothetical protein
MRYECTELPNGTWIVYDTDEVEYFDNAPPAHKVVARFLKGHPHAEMSAEQEAMILNEEYAEEEANAG